ncbi:unnamed protein product [Cylindrotheca closterium]|uniref:Deacetylase sirtuin-type domain-containing protein n=1 Tax=Cylindrotheca closterium TaxID=2856 RepID=A0AAD2CJG6_9STRA|nr:unnamed protein product [Cylindrotheca closterium]
MFGNVRGGGWFLHHKYAHQAERIQQWMQAKIDGGIDQPIVAIVEIGAGFNTPTVTRFPVESFARELGDRARFIRINPTEPEVPEDLTAVSLEEGWQVLLDVAKSSGVQIKGSKEADERNIKNDLKHSSLLVPKATSLSCRRYFGHFDWRRFLDQLRRD